MANNFKNLFDPAAFRTQGHALVDQLADYLAAANNTMPVLPWTEPAPMVERWADDFPTQPPADVTRAMQALLADVIAQSNHLHHPRYVGHQVTAPLPQAALWEMASTLLNNGMAVYEMGPVGTAMERSLIRWMGTHLGYDRTRCDGVLTSGGSAGNLTALLAARQDRAGFDAWTLGNHAGPPLCILAGEGAHYSVGRATQIMGWGADGVVTVPLDDHYRMRPDALPAALARAHSLGRKPIAVAASACSTATGSFDPLDAIADFCQREGLWLHVDGAHGASAALSPKYRHLLSGIQHADAVVWDAHKMLLMPALITAVIFKNGSPSFHAFAQHASYLFEGAAPEDEWFNLGRRTLECTKRMMSLKLYATLRLCGTQMFSDYVTAAFDLGKTFGTMLRAERDFAVPVDPECNIVCFRYTPPGETDEKRIDLLQGRIRKKLIEQGAFYLVQTALNGRTYLRVTLINPLTTESDLLALIAGVRTAAKSA